MRLIKTISPENALFFCVTALFCVTPLSSSLKSIFLSLTIAIIILTPSYRQQVVNLISQRIFLSGILLVLLAMLGCIWSPASSTEKILVLEKWSKLLYLPCLIVALKDNKLRKTAINAFIFAMVLTCLCSLYLKVADIPLSGKIRVDGIFRNHIMTSIMTGFATYLAGINFINAKNTPRVLYLISILITSSQILFVNESRTGYVIFLLLMILLVLQNTSKLKTILMAITIGILFGASYFISPTFIKTMHTTYSELTAFPKDKNTSIGYRMQFHAFAEKLFKENPLFGNGTGSFTYKFRTDNPVPAWTSNKSHSGKLLEPHGQYWLIAAEFGSLGLLLFCFFYFEIFYRALQLETMRNLALALLVIFAVGNLSDSLLFYSGSGYFFILFFALAFSENASSSIKIRSLDKKLNRYGSFKVT